MPIVTTTPPAPELYANEDLRELSRHEEATVKPFPFIFSMDPTRVVKDGFPYKTYFINHATFNMSSILDMPLDGIQEWVVVNERDESKDGRSLGMLTTSNHPFHIHTNAFQIVGMSHGEGVDYKVGDWRDVIAVPTPGNVTIRFRPVDFRGPTVAHCHAAAHSDAGMVALMHIV
jgi:FtsP/CotA-like multicopper oxidase with cupredoxin domain